MSRKILFVFGEMGCGGAERVIANVANYLCDQGDTVALHHFQSKDYQSFYALDSRIRLFHIDHHTRKPRQPWDYAILFVKALLSLRKVSKKTFQPDVIISLGDTTNMLVLMSTSFTKIPVIVREEIDIEYRSKGRYIFNFFRYIIYRFRATKVLVLSEKIKEFFGSFSKHVGVIGNSVPTWDRPKQDYRTQSKRIVTVGRLDIQKDHKTLIASFKNIHTLYPDYTLTIYGEGPLRQDLERLIKDLDLSSHVFLPGKVTDPLNRIEDADIFVMPSLSEGLGISVLEASSIGLPIIVSHTVYRNLVNAVHRESVLIFPVGDVDALTHCIKELIDNDELRQSIGENGKKIAQYYTVERIMNLWNNVINDAIEHSNA